MKYLAVSYATASTQELVAAPTDGSRIKVYGYHLVAAGAVVATLKSGSTGMTGAMTMATGVPQSHPVGGSRLDKANACMRCAPNEALNLTLGGAVQVSGWIAYDVEVE